MNSIFFPAEVVLILRRLANVISTLSISNQYLLHTRRGQAEGCEEAAADEKQTLAVDTGHKPLSTSIQKGVEWPTRMKQRKWMWPDSLTFYSAQLSVGSGTGLEEPDLWQGEFRFFSSDLSHSVYFSI